MGVTILPRSTAGASLAQLGSAIGRIVNPNLEFQQQLRAAIASDPNLAQTLAELERRSPGFLQNLGAGKTGAAVQDIPSSFGEELRNLGREEFGKLTDEQKKAFSLALQFGMSPIEAAKQLAIAPAVGAAAEAKPELVAEAGEQVISGRTRAQRTEEDFQTQITNLANSHLASIPLSEKERAAARAKLPELFADEDFRKRAALQLALANARGSDIEDSINRMREQDAIWWRRQTGVGSLEQWKSFLDNPIQGAETPELAEIAGAFTGVGVERKVSELSSTGRSIASALEALKEARGSDALVLVAQLNSLFARQAAIGGPFFRVDLGPTGLRAGTARFFTPKFLEGLVGLDRIRFLNEDGDRISPETVVALSLSPVGVGRTPRQRPAPEAEPSTPPTGTPPTGGANRPLDLSTVDISTLSTNARTALARIRASDDPEAAFAKLQQQVPTLAQEITSAQR
jgi:hypothetical protein